MDMSAMRTMTPPPLQAVHPDVGDATPRHTLPKIIHQVPPIEDRQRQQVQHPEAHADEGQEQDVRGQAEAGGFAGVIGDGQRAR